MNVWRARGVGDVGSRCGVYGCKSTVRAWRYWFVSVF